LHTVQRIVVLEHGDRRSPLSIAALDRRSRLPRLRARC
jgi:hypothetical protein